MQPTSFTQPGTAALFAALFAATLGQPGAAEASGPVERIVQLVPHPSDPKLLVARYSLAAEGFLFSKDGGRTFQAQCSEAITPDASGDQKLSLLYSTNGVSGLAPVVLDASGRVSFGKPNALWSDDRLGCKWSTEAQFSDKWPAGLAVDPAKPEELLAIVMQSKTDTEVLEATSSAYRRDASGSWKQLGFLLPPKAGQAVYASGLLALKVGSATHLYTGANVTIDDVASWYVFASKDGGATWSRGSTPLPIEMKSFSLLAVDPQDPKRLLAVTHTDGPDVLWTSSDEGKTFSKLGEVTDVTGVVVAPDGKVFLSDASGAFGGLFTASRVGEPFTKVEGVEPLDCLGWDAAAGKLRGCRSAVFGLIDPLVGSFEPLTSLREIESLLDCSSAGLDVGALCESQLNQGSSWCCNGHYPGTPFCGDYDVRSANGKTVYCGLAGREFEAMQQRDAGSASGADAGAKADGGSSAPKPLKSDAGATKGAAGHDDDHEHEEDDDQPAKRESSGCALRAEPGRNDAGSAALLGLSLLALGSVRRLRRRSR